MWVTSKKITQRNYEFGDFTTRVVLAFGPPVTLTLAMISASK